MLGSRLLSGFVLGVLLLGTVPSASAMSVSSTDISGYSVEQLEALIAKLQRQLEEMKKGSPCYVSEQELSIGDGEDGELSGDVRRLQGFLSEKGVFTYKPSGYFGKATRASLMALQKREGLDASGVFDSATRAKAHAMYCRKTIKGNMNEIEMKRLEEKKIMEKEQPKTGVVKSISLKASGRSVVWGVDGYSKMGFKVVWSKNSGPTYPTREGDQYQYFDGPTQSEAKLTDFSGQGVYYARVCEYLGGACGVYSNEVKIEL